MQCLQTFQLIHMYCFVTLSIHNMLFLLMQFTINVTLTLSSYSFSRMCSFYIKHDDDFYLLCDSIIHD